MRTFKWQAAHRGVAFGDIDNDGRIDAVVTVLNGSLKYFHNISKNNNHWIILKLVGKKSNRMGLGAKVRITGEDGKVQYNHATTAVGYASASDSRCALRTWRLTSCARGRDHLAQRRTAGAAEYSFGSNSEGRRTSSITVRTSYSCANFCGSHGSSFSQCFCPSVLRQLRSGHLHVGGYVGISALFVAGIDCGGGIAVGCAVDNGGIRVQRASIQK